MIRPWLGDNIKVCPFSDEPERIGLTTETQDGAAYILPWGGRFTVKQTRELAAGMLAACDWAEERGKL